MPVSKCSRGSDSCSATQAIGPSQFDLGLDMEKDALPVRKRARSGKRVPAPRNITTASVDAEEDHDDLAVLSRIELDPTFSGTRESDFVQELQSSIAGSHLVTQSRFKSPSASGDVQCAIDVVVNHQVDGQQLSIYQTPKQASHSGLADFDEEVFNAKMNAADKVQGASQL